MGLSPRASSAVPGGLGGQPQARAARVARGRACACRTDAPAQAAVGDGAGRPRICARRARTRCGRWTSRPIRPPTAGRCGWSTSSTSTPARRWSCTPRAASTPTGRRRARRARRPARPRAAVRALDNGPELTSHALRDWCRFSARRQRVHRARLPVAEPVRGVLPRPRPRRAAQRRAVRVPRRSPGPHRRLAQDYNQRRPHSALGMRAPAAFAAAWTRRHRAGMTGPPPRAARGRKPAARLALGLAFATSFRPTSLLACRTYNHSTLAVSGPKNGVRPRTLEPLERAIDRQIALLRERRQALITAAVTGKCRCPARPRRTPPHDPDRRASGGGARDRRSRRTCSCTAGIRARIRRTTATLALDTVELFTFIGATQIEAWEKLIERHGGDPDDGAAQVRQRLADELDRRGVVDVLRHGVVDHGVTIQLAYFKPAHGLTPELMRALRRRTG